MNEELPDLPSGWMWTTCGEAGDVMLGRQRSPKWHHGDHMRPYLRVKNVFEDRIDLSDVMEMDFPPDQYERYKLEPGDILLNEGQSPELVGRPAMYRGELPGACFTNSLIRFRARSGVDPQFALYVFLHHLRSGRFQREARITTNIAHLSAKRFTSVEFPVPPLGDQQRIVAAVGRHLERLNSAQESLGAASQRLGLLRGAHPSLGSIKNSGAEDERRRILAAREARFRAAEDQKVASHPGARRANYTEPMAPSPDLPQPPPGAVWMTLDELCHFSVDYRGKTPPKADSGIPTISAANVKEGVVEVDQGKCVSIETYKSWISRGLPEAGDLVVTTEAPVGAFGLFPDGGPYLPTRRVIVLKTGLEDNRYLLSALANPISQHHLRQNTRGSTVPRILKPALLTTPVPVIEGAAQASAIKDREATLILHRHVESAVLAARNRGSQLRRAILAAACSGRLIDSASVGAVSQTDRQRSMVESPQYGPCEKDT